MEELEVDGIDETSGRILIVEVEWWISGVHYTMLSTCICVCNFSLWIVKMKYVLILLYLHQPPELMKQFLL